VCETRVLKRIFEVDGKNGGRLEKADNEELQNL
jgi:hypothetical protein